MELQTDDELLTQLVNHRHTKQTRTTSREWILQSNSGERGGDGSDGERRGEKSWTGNAAEDPEAWATLRLNVGAETEDRLRRQRTNLAEGAAVTGEETRARCPDGEMSRTPLRDRGLVDVATWPPRRPRLVPSAVGSASGEGRGDVGEGGATSLMFTV